LRKEGLLEDMEQEKILSETLKKAVSPTVAICLGGDEIPAIQKHEFFRSGNRAVLFDLFSADSHFNLVPEEIEGLPRIKKQLMDVASLIDEKEGTHYREGLAKDFKGTLNGMIAGQRQKAGIQNGPNWISSDDIYTMLKRFLPEEKIRQFIQENHGIVLLDGKNKRHLEGIARNLGIASRIHSNATTIFFPGRPFESRRFNNDILQIQSALHVLGVLDRADVHGRFDEKTREALIKIEAPTHDTLDSQTIEFLKNKVIRLINPI
jgi:hypothetical protein